jgi:hypothetical protein
VTNVVLKEWGLRFNTNIRVPERETLVEFLCDGAPPARRPTVALSEQAQVQAWTIDQLKLRLDYLRVLVARGLGDRQQELDRLRDEIALAEDALRAMIRNPDGAA